MTSQDTLYTPKLFVDCKNDLGEGPIWHPLRDQWFWFDINGAKFYNADTDGNVLNIWDFSEPVAAAAIIDKSSVLIASASALLKFDIETGTHEHVCDLEADKPSNRSNDSRVGPGGGFWIGTMGKSTGDGSVYHYRAGKLQKLFGDISIPNSICFSPDGTLAYFTDTRTNKILKRTIDPATALPVGDWELFADVSDTPGGPDGSVVDSEGNLWNARYGGSCVNQHAPDGSIIRTVELPVANATCPAFGGPDLKTILVTSARQSDDTGNPLAGSVFTFEVEVSGQREHFITL